MAHSDPKLLCMLVNAIDNPKNDIYIHIDKKVDIHLFDQVTSIHSNLKFIENRIDTIWGTPTLIDAEIELFRVAFNNKYKRYHLLSGTDFPLKSQKFIHTFFDMHPKEEFISYEQLPGTHWEIYKKCHIYHYFLKYTKRKGFWGHFLVDYMRRGLMALQILCRVRRKFSWGELKKGSEWVSITHDAVDILLQNEETVKKQFRRTHCSDEIYKQTILFHSPLCQRISPLGNLRLIDFKRGTRQSPYIFENKDIEELLSSDALFARKFSSSVSLEALIKIKENISNN